MIMYSKSEACQKSCTSAKMATQRPVRCLANICGSCTGYDSNTTFPGYNVYTNQLVLHAEDILCSELNDCQ